MGGIGIIMIAVGHPAYYRMAITLAASVKHHEKTPICLVHDGQFDIFTDIEKGLFDNNMTIPGVHPMELKLQLYDISPFEQTVFMDVDMVMIPGKRVSDLVKSVQGCGFTIMNYYKKDASIWATVEDVRAASGNNIDPMYIPYSELMYFEKGEAAERLFTEALIQYKTPVPFIKFAGSVPDELPIITASLKTGVKPHQYNWLPVFWHFRSKRDAALQPHQLAKRYIAYSIGGNTLPHYVKAHYNNLSSFYCKKLGILPYQAKDKKYFLPNRSKI